MALSQTFKCPECGLKKTLKQTDGMTRVMFLNSLPAKVPCGVKGCEGYCVPESAVVDDRTDGASTRRG